MTILEAAPDLRERVLTVNGVSKAYAITGWRIGYGGGPHWLIAAMAKVQSQTAGSSCTSAQWAAKEALAADQDLVQRWRCELHARRDHAVARLSRSARLTIHPSQGAFYLFVGVEACMGRTTPSGRLIRSDLDLANYILDEAALP